AEQLQTDRIAQMRLKDRCCLVEIEELPVCRTPLFLGLASERIAGVRLNREAPMQVDAPKACRLFQKLDPVACEGFRDPICVLVLPGEIEAGHHTGVLVEASAGRQSAQGGF